MIITNHSDRFTAYFATMSVRSFSKVDNTIFSSDNNHALPTNASEESLDTLLTNGIKGHALSAKLSHVLSSSYADSDVRDSLQLIDAHLINNTMEARRRVRADVQHSLLEADAHIMQRFGNIAHV